MRAKVQNFFDICKKNHRFLVWKAIFKGKFLRFMGEKSSVFCLGHLSVISRW